MNPAVVTDAGAGAGLQNQRSIFSQEDVPANLRTRRLRVPAPRPLQRRRRLRRNPRRRRFNAALREILASVRTLGDVVNEADLSAAVLTYAERYPAAVAVRDGLGHEAWGFLESYRKDVTYLAVQFLQERNIGIYLHCYQQQMQQIVSHSGRNLNLILLQKSVDDALDDEDGTHGRKPMIFVREMFRRHPIFWLVYNLHFAPEIRHSWEAVSDWALQSLRQQGVTLQPPAWPAEIGNRESPSSLLLGLPKLAD